MKRIALIIISITLTLLTGRAQSLLNQADSAYNKEDYRLAIRLYQQAVEEQGVSPELLYNIGNAYYRIDELGKSVLYYQRALNLDPSMEDARTNLNFVKTKIIDKPEDDSSFLSNLNDQIISAFAPNAWAWIAFTTFALLLLCIAAYIFSDNISLRKTGFFGGIIIFIALIYVSVIAYSSADAYLHSNKAVVTVPTSNLRSAPGSGSVDNDKVIPIHEGTILEITDSIIMPGENTTQKWYDVKINNTTRAWVNASDIEKI